MSARTLDRREAEGILRSLRNAQRVRFAVAERMRDDPGVARRSHGTGSLFVKHGNWYGQWRVAGRLVKRKLGPVRKPGTREGLTRAQAERELQRRIEQETIVIARHNRMTVERAGDRYLHHLEHVMQRAASTVQDYGIMLERHLVPYFGGKAVDRIEPDDVVGYMAAKRRSGGRARKGEKEKGLSPKTIQNHVTFLHGLMKWSVKRGWARSNPVASVDRPPVEGSDPDIRFLTLDEVEAVMRKVPDDQLGPTDRVLYLAAAMTGARQGELVALRWRDIDWTASKVRIRRKRYRGKAGRPKSRRGSRSIPLADRLARELELHFQRSAYQAEDDLVFPHPETGNPYDTSKMGKRFEAGMQAAGMGDRYGREDGITFHSFRHTFATRCAAAGVPLRRLQEWLGHRDYKTVLIYADYQPDDRREADLVGRAFEAGINSGINLSKSEGSSEHRNRSGMRERDREGPDPSIS
jgi:integrase